MTVFGQDIRYGVRQMLRAPLFALTALHIRTFRIGGPRRRALRTPALGVATFAATTMRLLGIGMAACLIPAWRASRLDPNDTLREQ